MPKHEALTPKAIGKRIKSKGLQKLKFYCQMCQKQCRDANGFKCHTTSESHQRQLLLFAENPHKYMDAFSGEFMKDFLHLLKRRFGTKRVHVNQVYQEYIKDRDHLHMNSTRWVTLTGFVKWCGRKGICHVDNTEKGWFMTYIDRDPETLLKNEGKVKKEKLDRDYEERMAKIIEEQIERGKQQDKNFKDGEEESEASQFKKDNEDEKITFSIATSKLPTSEFKEPYNVASSTSRLNKLANPMKIDSKSSDKYGDSESVISMKRKKASDRHSKKSALEEIIEENERIKAKKAKSQDNWLMPDIVVKVVAKNLGEKYYKKKGVVQKLEDKYVGVVKMQDSNDLLKLDQAHLETVIPQIGRNVLVVKGVHRGCEAVLLECNYDEFCCKIRLESGQMKGRIVEFIKYEEICKKNT